MVFDMIAVWFALIVIAMLAIGGWVYAWLSHKKFLAYQESSSRTLAKLHQELDSINSSTIGVGQTLLSVEKKLNSAIESQQKVSNDPADHLFDHAADMASTGATPEEIAKQFGLPEAEVELMTLLKRRMADQQSPTFTGEKA